QHVGEAARAEVQRDGAAGGDLDEVDAVVGRVGVVLPPEQVGEVEIVVEGDGDRSVGAESVQLVEQGAGVALDLRGRHKAGVDAQAGGARRVWPGGQIVGEGNLRQRPARQIEHDLRPARLHGGGEP